MKKFLSVLLALAVAFTFTFGSTMSAFAAEGTPATSEQKANLVAAEKMAINAANTYLGTALDELGDAATTAGTTHYTVKNETWKSFSTDMTTELEKAITAVTTAQYTNYTATATTVSGLVTELYGATFGSVNAITRWIHTNYDLKATKAQFAKDYDLIMSKLDKVDLDLYSTTTPEDSISYQAMVIDRIAIVKDWAEGQKAATVLSSDVDNYADAMTAITNEINANLIATTVGNTTIESGKYKLSTYAITAYGKSILTKTEEANQNTTNAATAAAVKAKAQEYYAVYMTTGTPDKVLADAYLTVYTYLADEGIVTSVDDVAEVGVDYKTVTKNIADLEAYAEKYKAEKDANGNLIRDAKEIDKIVKKAKSYAFAKAEDPSTNVPAYSIETAKVDIEKAITSSVAADLAFAKEVKKATIEKNRTASLEGYYPLEAEKVNAVYDKQLTAVDKATTVAEVNSVSATPSLAGIKDADTVDALFGTGGTLADEFATQLGYLNNYVTYKNTGLSIRDANYVVDDTLAASLVEFYGEKGARTVAEMKALAADAKALVDALPTNGSIATAKADVEAKIAALPTTITASNKDDVIAAWTAMNDYIEMTGAADANATDIKNKALLPTAITGLHSALAYELANQVTAAGNDKAALKAVKEAIKAYNDLTEDDEIFEGKRTYSTTDVNNKLEAIRDAELAAVKKAIAALPINVTIADKAAVEAARAAYDAFVADWNSTDADEYYNAPYHVGSIAALTRAETAISELAPAYDDQDAKADLLDMSRKLTIWRTSKTSIKVTAVGSVKNIKDNGYTVKYKFYKKAPGATSYKLIKTTTSNKYTYTNLKKGTNKFQVKVCVYDADGKLVATKMTYYRAAKIK